MQNDLDLTRLDLPTAMRIAKARAQAARARETRAFFKSASKSIRNIFSAWAAHKVGQRPDPV